MLCSMPLMTLSKFSSTALALIHLSIKLKNYLFNYTPLCFKINKIMNVFKRVKTDMEGVKTDTMYKTSLQTAICNEEEPRPLQVTSNF